MYVASCISLYVMGRRSGSCVEGRHMYLGLSWEGEWRRDEICGEERHMDLIGSGRRGRIKGS